MAEGLARRLADVAFACQTAYNEVVQHVLRTTFGILLIATAFLTSAAQVQAASVGMHVLSPGEIERVVKQFAGLRKAPEQAPLYITLPFTLSDAEPKKLVEWQAAFARARDEHVVPIVRLATRFDPERNAWDEPSRADIVVLAKALRSLPWPDGPRHVILFNEPNHAKEWGGQVSPESYAALAAFAADWLHTEPDDYLVLPAAVDLAAPNGRDTMEGLRFWQHVAQAYPEIFDRFDAWNSHSYANPGFAGKPLSRGKNSLRGYQYELNFLRSHSSKEWKVYITETGWDASTRAGRYLTQYYDQAVRGVWSDERIVAVTPFLFAGTPGPFSDFSFVDAEGKPTKQWSALEQALKRWHDFLSYAE